MKNRVNEVVEIFTDGACKGNPGMGGWGALLRMNGGAEQELCGGEAVTTNNRMELMGAISALRALTRPCQIKLHTDSKYLIQGITEWVTNWKRNGWRTSDKKPVKNADLWQQLDGLVIGHNIEWLWVKGHSGHPGNERADELANRGVEQMLNGGCVPAYAAAQKQTTLLRRTDVRHQFVEDWSNTISKQCGMDLAKENDVIKSYVFLAVSQCMDAAILHAKQLDIGADDGYTM